MRIIDIICSNFPIAFSDELIDKLPERILNKESYSIQHTIRNIHSLRELKSMNNGIEFWNCLYRLSENHYHSE